MPVTDVTRPRWDKTRNRWVVRWTEDGQKRTRSTWGEAQQAEADEFRRSLLAAALAPPPVSKAQTAGEISALVTTYDGSAAWWDHAHGWLAVELLRATQLNDTARLDLLGKAARAFAPLAQSQRSHRDIRTLEETLQRLQSRYAELTQAAKHGTRVQPAASGGSAGGAVVHRDEPLH